MPPEMPFLEHSALSIESYLPATSTYGVLAGARLDNLFQSEDSIEDIRYFTPYTSNVAPYLNPQVEAKVDAKQPT